MYEMEGPRLVPAEPASPISRRPAPWNLVTCENPAACSGRPVPAGSEADSETEPSLVT